MVSRQETARPLLTPGEVMQLPPTDEIVMIAGLPPIRAKKLRYYEEPASRDRMLLAPVLSPNGYGGCPPSRGDDWTGIAAIGIPSLACSTSDEPPADPANGGIRQEPELPDITRSPIAPAVIESCLSRVFLPNARSIEPESRDAYARLGLNDRQIESIARAVPKREYWFQSAAGCRLFELGWARSRWPSAVPAGRKTSSRSNGSWPHAGLTSSRGGGCVSAAWLGRQNFYQFRPSLHRIKPMSAQQPITD